MRRFHSLKLAILAVIAERRQAEAVAATTIAVQDRPGGHHYGGTFKLDPGNIAGGAREVESVAVQGVAAGDVAIVSPRAAMSLIVAYCRCSANAIEFALENNTAGAIDLGNVDFDFQVFRGSTGPLR